MWIFVKFNQLMPDIFFYQQKLWYYYRPGDIRLILFLSNLRNSSIIPGIISDITIFTFKGSNPNCVL